jgi:hypothetical protein
MERVVRFMLFLFTPREDVLDNRGMRGSVNLFYYFCCLFDDAVHNSFCAVTNRRMPADVGSLSEEAAAVA